MNWVKKSKLPVVEAIQYEGYLCIKLENLWNALYKSFNSTQEREVDIHFLDKIPDKPTAEWNVFSKTNLLMSRLQKVDLVSFYFLFYFYFLFDLFFIFSIFRTLGLGLEMIGHICHI